MKRVAVVALCLVGAEAVVSQSQQQQQFWPFDQLFGKKEPTPTVAPAPPPPPPPPEPTMANVQSAVMKSEQFKANIDQLCKQAPKEDQEICRSRMSERMWCAMFARNIQRFLKMPEMSEYRKKCKPVNAMKGADWFYGATWSLPRVEGLMR
eukprot:gnl/TRDRNA2_/TRDRNA2_180408_c0_seq1.p1 gnl/TRDRNA2_/TRDRNA2_180408_c0~~gnl/TRDRNA2_/TRDRNA2_180408_c0_seq1.p1  ORF type:complete len:151 (+),score=45.92 gnl/TRDRNA2_/TRDRNA2_180408_c0_seq1:87-539(+)